MDVSVVISTWNNSGRLHRTLEALAASEVGAAWELVLVNNACTDDTDAVAEAFRDRLPLVYVHEPRPGLSHGRNAALAAARGRLIVFTDDDVRVGRDWIERYWRAYEQKPEGFYFGGPIDSDYEAAPPPDAPWLALAPPSIRGLDWGPAERMLGKGEFFVAANWACPASALAAVGGFDPKLGLNPASGQVGVGEESDLMDRLREAGWKAWYLPGNRIGHFVPAGKCTQAHVLERRIAQIRQEAARARRDRAPRGIGRLRLRAWAAAAWCKWTIARALGGRGLWYYAQWRGYREAGNSGQSAVGSRQ
jgi:glycosyltransferase involved in cell wall biosynthesis